MIELTAEQSQQLVGPEFATVRDPETGQTYVLVHAEAFERMQRFLKPFARGWEDPQMDEYEIYRKKKT